MPAYLRMLKGTKPVRTAVKGCQKSDQELQACLNSAGRDKLGGVNNCFDIPFCEGFLQINKKGATTTQRAKVVYRPTSRGSK